MFIKIAVTEVWPLKDGAWNCNGAVTECLAAKGGTLCARVGSKGIVECTSARKLQWVEFPGCYRARTDGYGCWEAVGVLIQWERAEMLVERWELFDCIGDYWISGRSHGLQVECGLRIWIWICLDVFGLEG